MRGGVTAFGGGFGLGHVLHHDVGRRIAADERGSLIADHGADPVIFAERVGGCAGAGFLSEAEIHAADDFALLVERFENGLHAAVEEHPAIDFDELLLA